MTDNAEHVRVLEGLRVSAWGDEYEALIAAIAALKARAAVEASQPKAEAVESAEKLGRQVKGYGPEAVAGSKAEVVAWLCDACDGKNKDATASEFARNVYAKAGRAIIPLYTHPQPSAAVTEGKVRSIVTNIFTDDFGSLTVMLPSNDWTTGSMVRVTLVSLPKRAALSQGGKP